MTQFITNEARESAVNDITRLIDVINNIPGNAINYLDASSVCKYLNQYRKEILTEIRCNDGANAILG